MIWLLKNVNDYFKWLLNRQTAFESTVFKFVL